MEPPQRDIIYRKMITVWAKSSVNAESYDLTQAIYGGLDFVPDSFYIKTISYISANENNTNAVPVMLVNFSTPGIETVIGVFSASGSISHPNDIFPCNFLNGDMGQNAEYRMAELIDRDVIDNTTLDKSSWIVAIEFIKYGAVPFCQ